MLIQLDFTVAFELAVHAPLFQTLCEFVVTAPAEGGSLGENLIAHRRTCLSEDQYQTGTLHLMFVIAGGSLGEALGRTEKLTYPIDNYAKNW